MNLKALTLIFGIFTILLVQTVKFTAQVKESGSSNIKEGLGRTWKGPKAGLIAKILTTKQKPPRQSGGRFAKRSISLPTPAVTPATIKFKPVSDSGVATVLADAFSTTPEERAGLIAAFAQIKQGYEIEVAKEGKSNDLAAAMAFFIAANVTAYQQTELPSDETVEKIYQSLRPSLAATPEFVNMSNTERQLTHDWMVYMGGFVLAGYLDAKQNGDATDLANFKEIADYSMRLALGIEGSKLKIGADGLTSGGVSSNFNAFAANAV